MLTDFVSHQLSNSLQFNCYSSLSSLTNTASINCKKLANKLVCCTIYKEYELMVIIIKLIQKSNKLEVKKATEFLKLIRVLGSFKAFHIILEIFPQNK